MKASVSRALNAPACMLGSGTLLAAPSLKTATPGWYLGIHSMVYPEVWQGMGGGRNWGRRGNIRWTRSWPGLIVGDGELAMGT